MFGEMSKDRLGHFAEMMKSWAGKRVVIIDVGGLLNIGFKVISHDLFE